VKYSNLLKISTLPAMVAGICIVLLGVGSFLFNSAGLITAAVAADGTAQEVEVEKGPQGGRLLTSGDFSLEITIFEKGIPPEFHVYAYRDDKLLPPDQVELTIELSRLGGKIDTFRFSPQGDYLRGDGIVREPHSFDVTVSAGNLGQQHRWSYENYEGRTRIAPEMAAEAGIETEIAGSRTIRKVLTLTGRIHADPNRLSRVRPRFPGVVQTVHSNLGDVVQKGKTLATVQSDESLQNYVIKAPIDGLIVHRDIQVGESTGEKLLFTIADMSVVWVELDVFSRNLSQIRSGQAVEIETFDGYRVDGTIDWISPLTAHASQSVQARVQLDNADGRLRPGQFVRGNVTVEEFVVPLAVQKSAIQRFRDFQVVFARVGDTYEVRMLELGRSDDQGVEVLGGLAAGTEYVIENSFLIKADIEKSGASHDH
jgi:cobalt-zinc-cadmium efflux system membrane fusion protein